MAWSSASVSWLCAVLAAMAVFFGEGAHARRSLHQLAPAPAPASLSCPNPTIANISLEAYTGVWYEIGSTALFKSIQESNLECITARYSLISDGDLAGNIRVRNDGYNTSSGELSTAIGYATITSPGRLSVTFAPGAPPGDYRIIYLSGEAEEKYETAIVYSCDDSATTVSQSLFILSRKPKLDDDETVAELLAFVALQGVALESNNQLVLTPQEEITCGRHFD